MRSAENPPARACHPPTKNTHGRRAILAGLIGGGAVGLAACAVGPVSLGRPATPPTIRVGLVTGDYANGAAIGQILQPMMDLSLRPPPGLRFRLEPTILPEPPTPTPTAGALHRQPELAALEQALHHPAATAGPPPDIILLPRADDAVYAGAKGLLRPLDAALDASPTLKRAAFYPAALQAITSQGHVWGLPLAMSPSVLTYDPAPLAEAGVAMPTGSWSWQQFADACTALTNPAAKRFALGPFQPLLSYLYLAGGRVLAADGRHSALTDAAAVAGLGLYEELAQRRKVVAAHGPCQNGPPFTCGGDRIALGAATVAADIGPNPAATFAPPLHATAGPVTDATVSLILGVTAHAADLQLAIAALAALADAAQPALVLPARRTLARQQSAGRLRLSAAAHQVALDAAEVAVAEPLDVDSLAALAMAQEAILAGTRDAVSAATAAAATINRNLAEQYG